MSCRATHQSADESLLGEPKEALQHLHAIRKGRGCILWVKLEAVERLIVMAHRLYATFRGRCEKVEARRQYFNFTVVGLANDRCCSNSREERVSHPLFGKVERVEPLLHVEFRMEVWVSDRLTWRQ